VVQNWATGWTIGILGFDSQRRLGLFIFTTASRTALGPAQPPIQWVPGALSLGIQRSGREADHSPPSSAEVKECMELYLHSPNTPSLCDAQLKHRDNFTLLYTIIRHYLHFQLTCGVLESPPKRLTVRDGWRMKGGMGRKQGKERSRETERVIRMLRTT
jgi:hypothetical protein